MASPLDAFRAHLARALADRDAAGLLRRLALPDGLDLTSNDYLGYASDPALAAALADAVRTHGAGAGAARLLRGHHPVHAAAEARLAAFSGREAALLFASGFAANLGLLPALAGPGDLVLSDALNHASLIDGIRLSRADRVVYPHHDLDAVEAALRRPRPGRAFVVTESVFSMDGDLTDLTALCDLADRHDALVVVDEAHATGLYGPRGSGRVEALDLSHRVLATVHTGGKALGVGGAWVAGDALLVAHLVNHARAFVFSTGVVPAIAAGLTLAVDRLAADAPAVAALHARAAHLRARLRQAGLDLARSESLILPIVLGDNARALSVAAALRRDGFDVRAVRPPTVPAGSARLRVTVRAPVPQAALDRFADRLLHHVQDSTHP